VLPERGGRRAAPGFILVLRLQASVLAVLNVENKWLHTHEEASEERAWLQHPGKSAGVGELVRSGVASTPPSWFFPSRMVARLTLLLALCSMLQATVALTVAPMRVCAATRGSVAMAEGMRSGDSVKVISGASKVCAIEAQSMWPRPRSPSPMPTAPPPRNVVSPGYGCEAAHA
jgi:hypothetical protein